MLFNSWVFIFAFLPTVYVGYLIARRFPDHRLAVLWLALASLFYYGWGGLGFLAIFICTKVVNAGIGRLLLWPRLSRRQSRIAFAVGIAANLATLGYFKYTAFLIANANSAFGTGWTVPHILLPIGISFFTFQNIAFLADIYSGKVKRFSVLDYVFFISFFPQLIAGPIVHHSEVMPQVRDAVKGPVFDNFCIGFSIFCIGLLKKVVVADACAVYADAGYATVHGGHPLDPAAAWITAVAYSFQIYYDFSGYSDMAIGLGRMFGFRLPLNFFSPYRSVNVVEFWRRWHITLSRFLRDYLYFPLGGNRFGPVRQAINLATVMLLGGLWHGANWTFVLWGAIHGALLGITHGLSQTALGRSRWLGTMPVRGAGIALTFVLVTLAWVPFRSASLDEAVQMFRLMFAVDAAPGAVLTSIEAFLHVQFQGWRIIDVLSWMPAREFWPAVLPPDFLTTSRPVGLWLALVAAITFLLPNTSQIFARFEPGLGLAAYPTPPRLALPRLGPAAAFLVGGVFVICVLHLSRISPFLYFQF